MEEPKDKTLDHLGGYLLFACAIALLVGFTLFCFRTCMQKPTPIETRITLKVDTLGSLSAESSAVVDSLIHAVNQANAELHDKYRYILQQKEDQETFFTIGGIFLTAVLSVFGFFGYRSFRSIEERAEIAATDKANERISLGLTSLTADVRAISQQEVMKLGDKLNNELKADFSTLKSETINPKLNEITSFGKDMKTIQERLSKLEIANIKAQDASQQAAAPAITEEKKEKPRKKKRQDIPFTTPEQEGGEA